MVGGNIVVMQGFGNPALTSLIEEWGGVGLIAVNPGIDIHWGTCTTIWGSPDLQDLPRKPKIPVVAVNNPDGKTLMALAEPGRRSHHPHRAAGRLVQAEDPGRHHPRRRGARPFRAGARPSTTAGTSASATTRPATPPCSNSPRVLWQSRRAAPLGQASPGGRATPPAAMPAPPGSPTASPLELDEHCLAQINCDSPGCRWATSYHETARLHRKRRASPTGAIRDIVPDAEIAIRARRRPATTASTISACRACSCCRSTMPEALRREKNYYDVSGCGANIAWHTENDTLEIADRDILLTDMRIYLLSALRVANAEMLPFDWERDLRRIPRNHRRATSSRARHGRPLRRRAPRRSPCKPALAGSRLDGAGRRATTRRCTACRASSCRSTTRASRASATTRPTPCRQAAHARRRRRAAGMPTGHLRRFGEVELMRGQNRYVAAIDAARRLVEAAL